MKYSLPNIEGAMKGNDSVQNGIARLQMYKMHVHPSCQNAIMELSSYHYEKDTDGNYTGKPEKLDDHCLVAGTMVMTDHGEVPIEDIQVGDMVLTHLGYRKVLAAGITRPEPVEIWRMTCTDGTVIEGTADHPFMTNCGVMPMAECKGAFVAKLDAVTPEYVSKQTVLFNRLKDPLCISLDARRRIRSRTRYFHKVMLGRVPGCGLVKVVSVKSTCRYEVVYDLTVDEAQDFFCSKVLSLNCVDALRYSCERFISKAKGKVAEAKGEDAPRSRVIGTNSGDSPEQPVQRRSRRVASSSRGSMI